MTEGKNKRTDALIPIAIALTLLAGIVTGIRYKNSVSSDAGVNRRMIFFSTPNKMTQAFEYIKSSYVDSISFAALEEDAIRGMLKSLDPHSQYIPAQNFADVNDPLEGNFTGIGVNFYMPEDTIVIVNVVAEGPSEKAGVKAGDRIIFVDDIQVAGVKMNQNDVVKKLKGPNGTRVKVGIFRRGVSEQVDLIITRSRVPLPSIDAAYMIASEIGYIKLNKFSKTTYQEFSKAAGTLKGEGMKKMIIDLRDNPGGIIDGAIKLSEMFLPAGKLIVYTEGNERGRTNYYSNNQNPEYCEMELALLIDETSASASEIVAGAIQDNDRGTIIGRRSYGKGLVQEQHPLMDGSALRITIARYYTPTGRCIQKPYQPNDNGNYFNELNTRYSHGEMQEADSIRFNHSLRYETPGGRIVYGGGGIMPDVFIPVDTTGISSYYRRVMRLRLFERFAFDYSDQNRKKLEEFADHNSFATYLRQNNIRDQFVAYVAKNGVAKNDKDLNVSGALIENIVMALIAKNIIDDKGYCPILNQMDKMVQKGVEVLTVKSNVSK